MDFLIIIINIFLAILIYVLCIIYHELGHLAFFKFSLKKKPKVFFKNMIITIGTPEDYKDMTDKEYMVLLECGILVGVIPILIMMFIDFQWVYLFAAYLLGCKNDLKQLQKLGKSLPQEDKDDI